MSEGSGTGSGPITDGSVEGIGPMNGATVPGGSPLSSGTVVGCGPVSDETDTGPSALTSGTGSGCGGGLMTTGGRHRETVGRDGGAVKTGGAPSDVAVPASAD